MFSDMEKSEPKFDYEAANHTLKKDMNLYLQNILVELKEMNERLTKLERTNNS